jgi:hypothetical protein
MPLSKTKKERIEELKKRRNLIQKKPLEPINGKKDNIKSLGGKIRVLEGQLRQSNKAVATKLNKIEGKFDGITENQDLVIQGILETQQTIMQDITNLEEKINEVLDILLEETEEQNEEEQTANTEDEESGND